MSKLLPLLLLLSSSTCWPSSDGIAVVYCTVAMRASQVQLVVVHALALALAQAQAHAQAEAHATQCKKPSVEVGLEGRPVGGC